MIEKRTELVTVYKVVIHEGGVGASSRVQLRNIHMDVDLNADNPEDYLGRQRGDKFEKKLFKVTIEEVSWDEVAK